MQENNKRPSYYKWLILFVVVIGTFMSALSSSIINIAVSKIMTVFGVSMNDVKWIATAYSLTTGAIVPLTGYLMATFGNKRIFIYSLSTFITGSFLCGFAWSNSSLIAFRIIQALGGGMIMPVGMTMIMQTFSPEERGTALGFWGIASMAAPAIGPTLGGYIIQNMDWRLIFYLNVPIGIIGIIMAVILLENTPRKPFERFDVIGFFSSAIGIVSLLYVLGEGSSIDWGEIKNPILLTIGSFSLLIFIVNELKHPKPLLDLRILKNFGFGVSQIIQIVLTFAMMGGMYVVPLFLQSIMGFTAMQTGMIMFPAALVQGLMMPIGGKLFDKFGLRMVALAGCSMLAISSYSLAFINMDWNKSMIVLVLAIRGMGIGLAMMPITTAGMNAVPTIQAGGASALNNMIKQISGALGVTIMTMIMQRRLDSNYGQMAEQITSFNPGAVGTIGQLQGLLMQNGYSSAEAGSAALSLISGSLQKQAYVNAIDYALTLTTAAVVVTIALVLILRDKKQKETID